MCTFWVLVQQATCALTTAKSTTLKYQAGPLIHDFQLTLKPGVRREAVGQFYYAEQSGSQRQWAVPPFVSRTWNPDLEYEEIDVLYPLLTYDRFGEDNRVQLMQLLSLSDSSEQDESVRNKLTIFPFYFQQRSTNEAKNYTALMPFYGTIHNRMLRDEVTVVMFPLYSMTRKRDVKTYNYLYPFFHLRRGDNLRGWQLWPLVGDEVKKPYITNDYLGLEVFMPSHRKQFAAWPFMFRHHTDIGSTNEAKETTVVGMFNVLRSPARDETAVLWPFFRYVDDRERQYREWGFPYPIWGLARGEGKHMNRLFPLYSYAENDEQSSGTILWPLLKTQTVDNEDLVRRRQRVMFFLFNNLREHNPQTGKNLHRQDLWPLYSYRKVNGKSRLQVLSILAPVLASKKGVERNWSPLWALWRSEKNEETKTRSESLLWNVWRRRVSPSERVNSYFFGLLNTRKTTDGTRWRWFHPVRKRDGTTNADSQTTGLQPVFGPIQIRPVSPGQYRS
ncbi:MAG: hypothetical protein ACPGVU_01530 [Limisphaerales bacterium]